MVLEHNNYRSFLKAELADRIAGNNAYSLRAFAQKLNLSNSFLCQVLQGKKTLSASAALKVAIHLELNEVDSRYFSLLVELDGEADPAFRESVENKLKEINPKRTTADLSVDVFRTISDWHHFAILELTYLADFVLTPTSAARKLGITAVEAEAAIERLLRLELLQKNSAGRLTKTTNYVIARSHVPNKALQNFHKQLLQKASDALFEQAPLERVSSSDIVPIDSQYLEDVRKLSDQFTSELLKLAEKSKRRDHVYCLGVHFFKLTPERKK